MDIYSLGLVLLGLLVPGTSLHHRGDLQLDYRCVEGEMNLLVSFVVEECITCGITFAMTEDYSDELQRNHAAFYCPKGHSQCFISKTKEEKRIERLEQDLKWTSSQLNSCKTASQKRDYQKRYWKGKVTQLLKSVGGKNESHRGTGA